VSEDMDPEDNMSARFGRGFCVPRVLFKMGRTFNDGDDARCRVSGHTFAETSSDRAPCQRDKLQPFMNWR
jgi:hypothetical protein